MLLGGRNPLNMTTKGLYSRTYLPKAPLFTQFSSLLDGNLLCTGLSPEFLRVCSGQRRGSLMNGCLSKGLKPLPDPALNQYGLCEENVNFDVRIECWVSVAGHTNVEVSIDTFIHLVYVSSHWFGTCI